MDRSEFYKEQALKFRDYAGKNPDRDLVSLFDEWADSKDFSEEDKKEIWKITKEHYKSLES